MKMIERGSSTVNQHGRMRVTLQVSLGLMASIMLVGCTHAVYPEFLQVTQVRVADDRFCCQVANYAESGRYLHHYKLTRKDSKIFVRTRGYYGVGVDAFREIAFPLDASDTAVLLTDGEQTRQIWPASAQ